MHDKVQDDQKYKRINNVEQPFACDQCGATFREKYKFKRHLEIHKNDKFYPCEFCPSIFGRSDHLTRHKKIHRGEKPFQCGICKKCFDFADKLKRHYTKHSSEKPFQCDLCSTWFKRKDHLKRHNRVQHLERGIDGHKTTKSDRLYVPKKKQKIEKPYKRDTCKKVCIRLYKLQVFTCKICHLSFSRLTQLKMHKLFHARNLLKRSSQLQSQAEIIPRKSKRLVSLGQNKLQDSVPKTNCVVHKVKKMHKLFHGRNLLKRSSQLQSQAEIIPRKPKRLVSLGQNKLQDSVPKTNCVVHKVKTIEALVICLLCSGSFVASKLTEHLKEHSTEFPFKCTRCQRSFNHYSHLEKHNETQHKCN